MTVPVRDVVPAPAPLQVEAVAGPAFELLIGLSAATTPERAREDTWVPEPVRWSRELQAAIGAVGARSGEVWLHLLGLALELPSEDSRSFVRKVSRVPQGELRRHVVGVYVPAWTSMLGGETLERVAAGDRRAIEEALAHPRYYAGHAREALGRLLDVPAKETKELVLGALRLFAEEVLAPREQDVVPPLLSAADSARALAATLGAGDVISRLTQGYVYEPEPGLPRVVLVPQVALRPSLLLCQHRDARVICYPLPREHVDPEIALSEQAVTVGRALADETRVRILRHLAVESASLDVLAERVGLARSTAHHHLGQLRAAGLVTLRGNAQGYSFALRSEGLAEAQRTIGELARAPSAPPAKRRTRRRSAGRPRKRT